MIINLLSESRFSRVPNPSRHTHSTIMESLIMPLPAGGPNPLEGRRVVLTRGISYPYFEVIAVRGFWTRFYKDPSPSNISTVVFIESGAQAVLDILSQKENLSFAL